jgi:ribosome maturation factor RimP
MDPLIALIHRAIEAAGFEVVQAKIDGRRNIRVWVDREVGGVTVSECSTLTRRIRDTFEEDGLDPGSFQIEILSPGLDRLLVREKDFARFAGKQVVLRLKIKRGDRRQFKGTLQGMELGRVRLTEGTETHAFDLAREVDEVRLVPDVPFPTAAQLAERRSGGAPAQPGMQKGQHGHRKRKRKR